MAIPNLVVAEYSAEQKCFHIQSLTQSLIDSLECVINSEPADFYIIGVFESEIAAHEYIEKVRERQLSFAK